MSEAPAVRVNWPILAVGVGAIVAFAALMIVGFALDPRALDTTVLVDKRAPDFTLNSLEGERVSLSELRGRPVVINFWSTWCVPCRQEHPVLQRAPGLYPEAAFLGVVYQDEAAKVSKYLSRAPVPYEQLLDPDSKVAIAYGVTGVPETFFIDPDGRVVEKLARPIHEGDLARILEPMLR